MFASHILIQSGPNIVLHQPWYSSITFSALCVNFKHCCFDMLSWKEKFQATAVNDRNLQPAPTQPYYNAEDSFYNELPYRWRPGVAMETINADLVTPPLWSQLRKSSRCVFSAYINPIRRGLCLCRWSGQLPWRLVWLTSSEATIDQYNS